MLNQNHNLQKLHCWKIMRKWLVEMFAWNPDNVLNTIYSSFFMASLFFKGIKPPTFSLMSVIWVFTCPITSSTAAWSCGIGLNFVKVKRSRVKYNLVVFVNQWQWEEANPGEHDKCHHVEPETFIKTLQCH